MPPKTRGKKRPAPESTLITSNLFGDGRRLKPYGGSNVKLLLSIDIGTTFSAASFCILRPRCSPDFEIVTSWPGQTTPDAKVPSVLYYDRSGTPMAWGAETLNEDCKAHALEESWSKVEWFKLSLRPFRLVIPPDTTVSPSRKSGKRTTKATDAPFPPPQSSIAQTLLTLQGLPFLLHVHQVYKDFIYLMFEHIKSYICQRYSSGLEIWNELFPTMEVIFTIPNGWEWKQQYDIRVAAVKAGLMGVTDQKAPGEETEVTVELMDEAFKRIRFVSEAEAAVVYAADSGHINPWLKVGEDIILCDAGGGTIDTTAYTITKERPLELKEKFAPKCVIAGAVLANCTARDYIADKVKGTAWDTPQRIHQLMEEFERDTKKRFGPSGGDYGIGQGGTPEWIEKANIRNGRLYIPSRDFEMFFEPTLAAIKTGIKDIHQQSGGTTKNVIMVGGLMDSSYAYTNLESWGLRKGLKFTKPDGIMGKTVTHGALLWYLAKPVKAYITRFHYGSDVSSSVDESGAAYHGREVVLRTDGVKIVENLWGSIASMGEELNPNKPVVMEYEKYFNEDRMIEELEFEEKIFICRGVETPTFITTHNGQLHPGVEHVCSVVVNLEELFAMTPGRVSTENGKIFKILNFSISIINDGYDLKAFASWNNKGKKYKGEARVVAPNIFV